MRYRTREGRTITGATKQPAVPQNFWLMFRDCGRKKLRVYAFMVVHLFVADKLTKFMARHA